MYKAGPLKPISLPNPTLKLNLRLKHKHKHKPEPKPTSKTMPSSKPKSIFKPKPTSNPKPNLASLGQSVSSAHQNLEEEEDEADSEDGGAVDADAAGDGRQVEAAEGSAKLLKKSGNGSIEILYDEIIKNAFFATCPIGTLISYLHTYVLPHTPTDGVARIFPQLLHCDWESNSRQLSCNSLKDLNSGLFANWATAAVS